MYTLKEGWGTLKSIQKHASGGRELLKDYACSCNSQALSTLEAC